MFLISFLIFLSWMFASLRVCLRCSFFKFSEKFQIYSIFWKKNWLTIDGICTMLFIVLAGFILCFFVCINFFGCLLLQGMHGSICIMLHICVWYISSFNIFQSFYVHWQLHVDLVLGSSYRDILHCNKRPFYLKGLEDTSIMDAYIMHSVRKFSFCSI